MKPSNLFRQAALTLPFLGAMLVAYPEGSSKAKDGLSTGAQPATQGRAKGAFLTLSGRQAEYFGGTVCIRRSEECPEEIERQSAEARFAGKRGMRGSSAAAAGDPSNRGPASSDHSGRGPD
jgi:hypothetical protein